MEDPETLEAYRELTPQQRKNVRKPVLQNILDSISTNNGTDPDATVVDKLDQILNELKDMKEKNQNYDNEVKRLQNVVNNQNKILSAQQKFMEELDRDKRANDLIVLSLPENEEDDSEKFSNILRAIDIDPDNVQVSSLTRLGRRDEGNSTRNRPLKVTLEQKSKR